MPVITTSNLSFKTGRYVDFLKEMKKKINLPSPRGELVDVHSMVMKYPLLFYSVFKQNLCRLKCTSLHSKTLIQAFFSLLEMFVELFSVKPSFKLPEFSPFFFFSSLFFHMGDVSIRFSKVLKFDGINCNMRPGISSMTQLRTYLRSLL